MRRVPGDEILQINMMFKTIKSLFQCLKIKKMRRLNPWTILCAGMMIESMAGKSAAMHGLCHDATPFTFSEDHSAVDHFGQLLTKGKC